MGVDKEREGERNSMSFWSFYMWLFYSFNILLHMISAFCILKLC